MHVARRATVGDDAAEIARAVGEALERTGAVITTGGLGPTSDDLTKQSIAELFGRGMHLDEEHLALDGGALAQAVQPPAARRRTASRP